MLTLSLRAQESKNAGKKIQASLKKSRSTFSPVIIFTWRTPSGTLLTVFFKGKLKETSGCGNRCLPLFQIDIFTLQSGLSLSLKTNLLWPCVINRPLPGSAGKFSLPPFTVMKKNSIGLIVSQVVFNELIVY